MCSVKNYEELTDLEFVEVVDEFTESWVTGLSNDEIANASAVDIKEWMTLQANDAKYYGYDWADMINSMDNEELDELSSAIKRRSEEWISDERDDKGEYLIY